MSYRIITHRDFIGGHGVERSFILDVTAGKIIAEVHQIEGCKPLVELANRAAAEAVGAAKKRTEAAGGGSGGGICGVCGYSLNGPQCQKEHT